MTLLAYIFIGSGYGLSLIGAVILIVYYLGH